MTRLAVVTTHPIQYYAPWFRHLASQPGLDLKVWYLWDFGVTEQKDQGFGQVIRWDVPLLDGYSWEFVPNRSRRPGTHHFWGIDNPELPRRLRDHAPDAVLCLGYNYATFARLLVRRKKQSFPLLLRGDSHRLVPRRGLRAWLKSRVLRAVFRRFDAFLYVGDANRAYWRQHGVSEERLFFSPHAVDNERFMAGGESLRRDSAEWKRELGIPEGRLVILFVGKFEDKKRPFDLLAAFARSGLTSAALLFVGSGTLEKPLRQAAAAVPHTYFAPFQNQSQMPRTYATGDVIVLPSYGPSETWGLCINEAMCLGKPAIVSTHVGCARDLVQHNSNGLVFPAGDIDALAESLRRILEDPAKRAAMGTFSRERIEGYGYRQATAGIQSAMDWLGHQ
jgi:glycosyltransferase involved in cell wall biosynthesis